MLNYVYEVATLIAVFAVGSLGLAVIVGQAGLMSLAHGAFIGVGAYVYGLLSVAAGVEPLIALVAAIAITSVVGAFLAYAASGLDEEQFAVTTLAFNVLIVSILTNWAELTRGSYGIAQIPRVSILGFGESRIEFLIVSAALAAGTFFFMQFLVKSGFGTLLRASAFDKDMVESLGSSVRRLRVGAFAVGCAAAGLAGALYAMHSGYIAPQLFELHMSILILAMVIIGEGRAMIGAVMGASILILIPELLRFAAFSAASAGPLRQVIFGGLLVTVVFVSAMRNHASKSAGET
ncbi:MAG: branched-chain amino acid ABC transporter permease [Alphaproteobacteria bacterium]